jgi:hypothetical protein
MWQAVEVKPTETARLFRITDFNQLRWHDIFARHILLSFSGYDASTHHARFQLYHCRYNDSIASLCIVIDGSCSYFTV